MREGVQGEKVLVGILTGMGGSDCNQSEKVRVGRRREVEGEEGKDFHTAIVTHLV
jgi:hypothetical protein